MRPVYPFVLVASLLPLSGCCSLARLFCGPDKSEWVQIDYATPTAAVRTLLEAIRRDAPDVVYDSLAAEYCARQKLDSTSAQVAWQQLKAATPGLHLAGYATVPAPLRLADDGATFVLDIEGRTLRIDLVRESFWEIGYVRPKGTRGEGTPGADRKRLTSWNTLVHVEPVADADHDYSRLIAEPVQFEHEGLDTLPLEAIEHVGLVRRWKVAGLAMAAP